MSTVIPVLRSTEEPHARPARPPSPAEHGPPGQPGGRTAQSSNPLWLQQCLSPSIPSHPIPAPINHFWQVAGKQLLMIVLLRSAGSHLLTLPAVVCLPSRDRCRKHASRRETAQNAAGNLPWSKHGRPIALKKTFGTRALASARLQTP